MLRNLSCPPPCTLSQPKKCLPCAEPMGDKKIGLTQLLEPDFHSNDVKWNRTTCKPCKGVYTWISSPRAMYNNRKMVKQTAAKTLPQPQNIMYDKRIVRGSNFSQPQINSQVGDDDCCSKEAEAKRRQMLRKKVTTRTQRGIIGTPPPVKGRKHENIQTEKYLEELFARPPEFDVMCQTDLFLHRPPSPPYVPAKTGVDAITEIFDGDLFDFDTEVQPILETLIGRAVEQALLEVTHEEELADMRQQQQQFLATREAEMAELRRLEAQEMRLQTEKLRRQQEELISKELDEEMQERVTAAKLLQGHIADLLPGVLNSIEPYLEADNREQLESQLGPWLATEVAEEVGQMVDSRELLEEIVREILHDRAARYMKMAESPEPELSSSGLLAEEADFEVGEEDDEEGDVMEDDAAEATK